MRWQQLEQIDPLLRLRVVLALSLLILAATFLILFTRTAARWTRWYINRPPRPTRLVGDPLARVIGVKPRLWQREQENWRRPL